MRSPSAPRAISPRWRNLLRLAVFVAVLPSIIEPFWPGLDVGNDAVRDLLAGLDIAASGAVYNKGPGVFGGVFGTLGPAYYYLLAIPWFSGDPGLALAIMIAVIRLLTLYAVYATARRLADPLVGWIACLVFVTLPVVVGAANPLSHAEFAPLFSALAVWVLARDRDADSPWPLGCAGALVAVAAQFHLVFCFGLPAILWEATRQAQGVRARGIVAALAGFAAVCMVSGSLSAIDVPPFATSPSSMLRGIAGGISFDATRAFSALGGLYFLAAVIGLYAWRRLPSKRAAAWRPLVIWLAWTWPVAVAMRVAYVHERYALVASVPLAILISLGLSGENETSSSSGEQSVCDASLPLHRLRMAALLCAILAALVATGERTASIVSVQRRLYEPLRWTERKLANVRGEMHDGDAADVLRLVHGLDADGRPLCTPYSACLPLLEYETLRTPNASPPALPQRHYRFNLRAGTGAPHLVAFLPRLDLAKATIVHGEVASPLPLPFRAIDLMTRRSGERPSLLSIPVTSGPIEAEGNEGLSVSIPLLPGQRLKRTRIHALAGAWFPNQTCQVDIRLDDRRLPQTTAQQGLYTEATSDVSGEDPPVQAVVTVRSCRLMFLDVFDDGEDSA